MSFKIVDSYHYSSSLAKLCMSWDQHDVVLVCKDGVKLPAHKLILSCRVMFFRDMFKRWKDSSAGINEVNLSFSSECIKKLLGFLYSGKLDPTDCDVPVLFELMDASRMMLLMLFADVNLYDGIEKYIIKKVLAIPRDDDYVDDEDDNTDDEDDNTDDEDDNTDDENAIPVTSENIQESQLKTCVEILNLSIEHHFPTLVNLSISFIKIKETALQFLQSDSFTDLSPPALCELLHLDALADSAEVGIFNAVVCWLHTNQDHMELKATVLSKIRLDQMSLSQIFDVVKPSGLFNEQELLDGIESIAHGLQGDNAREVVGRLGCMEKVSPIPMWITEMKSMLVVPQFGPELHLDDEEDKDYVPEEDANYIPEELNEARNEEDESTDDDADESTDDEEEFAYKMSQVDEPCKLIYNSRQLKHYKKFKYLPCLLRGVTCENCMKKTNEYLEHRNLL